MEFKSAQYMKDTVKNENNCVRVITTDDSEIIVPMNVENADYQEVLKLVKEGKLTIKEAD
mgnify:CR=1 FL=1